MERNLIYHTYPLKNSIWKWNCEMMSSYISVFNGKRIIGISTDDKTEDPIEVKKLFGDKCEYIIHQNDPILGGEVGTFLPALKLIDTGLVFYAHTKGVTKPTKQVMAWARAMYYLNLTFPTQIDSLIKSYSAIGCFRLSSNSHSNSSWYYSGGFFWFRRDAIKVLVCEKHYYGVEQFLHLHIPLDKSYNLFKINKSLYDEEILPQEYERS
jgi:hypothetical protein